MSPSGQTFLEQEWKERHLFRPDTWLLDDSTGIPSEQPRENKDLNTGPKKKA
jgi:hypothetical protein